MPNNLTPLRFRNMADINNSTRAKRDRIEYVVTRQNTNSPWFIQYIDPSKSRNFTTHKIREFDTRDAGEQFCQDIYAGKVNIEDLCKEVLAKWDEWMHQKAHEEEQFRKRNQAEAEQFRNDLAAQGMDLKTFLDFHDAMELLRDTTILYRMAEEQEGDAEQC